MINISKLDFINNIIAQSDNDDWQESGWVCWKHNDTYFLAPYSHCSCYGTYEGLSAQDFGYTYVDDSTISDLNYTWSGTREDLLNMAKNKLDPAMPERKALPEDYDYQHLMNVYSQIQSEI